MRILITNDDGINAPGLAVLEAIAADVAGDDGEVWTVAPAFEQSGVAHGLTDRSTDGVTGKCIVLITPDAERSLNTHLGISETLSTDEV